MENIERVALTVPEDIDFRICIYDYNDKKI
jgi:hypothetical protein